jgi:hypothetical protein
MRNFKMLGLALISVFALVAFAGATTASATVLCKVATSPCPAGSVYPSGTTLTGSLKPTTNAVLTTSGGSANPTLTCTSSNETLVTTSAGGGAGVSVTGNLTALSFTSCTSTNPSGCSSSGTVSGLPKSGSAAWTGSFGGNLVLNAPTVSFTCPILGFPVTCNFGTGTVTGVLTGGNPVDVKFTNQSIPSSGGFGCPTAATWNADYNGTGTNAAVWVTNS